MVKLAVRPALLVAAGVLGLAACSSPQPGTALPTGGLPSSSTGAGQSTSTTPVTPSSGGSVGTSAIEPCSLLGAGDIAEYGTFGEPAKENLGGDRVCGYQRERKSASEDVLTISIDVRDQQGVKDVTDIGGGVTTGNVHGRKAAQTEGPASSACILALAVGEGSRVDVSVNAGDSKKACEIATKVADIVEPKLPKG